MSNYPKALELKELSIDTEFQFSLDSEGGKECKGGNVLYNVKASDGTVYSMFLTNKDTHKKIHDSLSPLGIGSVFGIIRSEVPDVNDNGVNVKFMNEYKIKVINKADVKYPDKTIPQLGGGAPVAKNSPVNNAVKPVVQSPVPTIAPPVAPPVMPTHDSNKIIVDKSFLLAAAMLNAGRGEQGMDGLKATVIKMQNIFSI